MVATLIPEPGACEEEGDGQKEKWREGEGKSVWERERWGVKDGREGGREGWEGIREKGGE